MSQKRLLLGNPIFFFDLPLPEPHFCVICRKCAIFFVLSIFNFLNLLGSERGIPKNGGHSSGTTTPFVSFENPLLF